MPVETARIGLDRRRRSPFRRPARRSRQRRCDGSSAGAL